MHARARKLSTTAMMVLMLAAGCAAYDVDTSYDHNADFSGYESFAFMPERTLYVASDQPVSPFLEENLESAVVKALTAKGYRLTADAQSADLVVAFTLGSREGIQASSYPVTYRGAWGYGVVVQQTDVRSYTEGVLAVDMYDVDSRRPVWHGTARKHINKSDRGNAELIDEVVAAILAAFPPDGDA